MVQTLELEGGDGGVGVGGGVDSVLQGKLPGASVRRTHINVSVLFKHTY